MKRVLHYLKGSITHGLMLHKCDVSNLNLVACNDSDWVGLAVVMIVRARVDI